MVFNNLSYLDLKTLAFYHFKIFIEGQSIAKEVYNISESIKTQELCLYIFHFIPRQKSRIYRFHLHYTTAIRFDLCPR